MDGRSHLVITVLTLAWMGAVLWYLVSIREMVKTHTMMYQRWYQEWRKSVGAEPRKDHD